MARILRYRTTYNESDKWIKRTVRSPEVVVAGLMIGTFKSGNRFNYCLKSTDGLNDEWYEIPAGCGFPLIKKYEELFDE